MKRRKLDVSHRIRRRELSIFREWWIRLILGTALGIGLGLYVGPPVAAWLSWELGMRGVPPEERAQPLPRPVGGMSGLAGGAATEVVDDRNGEAAGRAERPDSAVVAARPTALPPEPVRHEPGAPLYRIQMGAFLDHRNADRLVARLRDEGLGADTRVVEQPRLVHRVVVDGSDLTVLGERVRALGFAEPEATPEGIAVTGPVPMSEAVEAARRLREAGLSVRVKQEEGSATFRVVRVGAYGSSEEAAQALARLSALGFQGFVVRER